MAGLRDSSGRPPHRPSRCVLIWQGWRGTEGLRSAILTRRMVGCFPCGTSPANEVKARLHVPPGEPVGPIQVSDDGQWVAQASKGETKLYALVWNTPTPEPKKIFLRKPANIREPWRSAPMEDSWRAVMAMTGSSCSICSESVPRPLIRSDSVTAACFSRDGRFLVYLLSPGSSRLWSVSRHQEVAALDHPGWPGMVCRQPSARTAALSPRRSQGFPFGSHLEAIRLRRKTGPVRA